VWTTYEALLLAFWKKIQAERDKEFVYAVTDEIRAGLNRAGISEEEILEDFNRFRRTLPRE
jgi:hypothetical protein